MAKEEQNVPKTTTNGIRLMDQIITKTLIDEFGNSQMGIGGNDANVGAGMWQYTRNFLDWFLWTTLYNESWVFRNGIDKKNKSTVSEIEISSDAEPTEILNTIKEYDKVRSELKDLLIQTSIYGGAATLMLIEGFISEEILENPLKISNIPKGAKMSLYTRDRWNGLQWEGKAGFEAIGTKDFGKSKFYSFYMNNGEKASTLSERLKAHHTFVLRGRNRKATTYTEYQLSGWDMPEGHHVLQELLRDETTRGSAVSLISKSLIEIFKMPGIRSLFSGLDGSAGGDSTGAKQEIEARISAITKYRNFNNASFMDGEDEYSQFQFSGFTGIADMLEKQKTFTAGAMEVPELVLYGSVETKGLVFSDGKLSPEFEVYQQTLSERQEYILRPIMDKLLPVLWRIANGTDMPENTTYTFLPVFKESQLDKLNKSKVLAETLQIFLENEVYTPQMAAIEIRQHSKQSGFGTNITDEVINKISDEFLSDKQAKLEKETQEADKEEEIKLEKEKKKEEKYKFNKKEVIK